MTGQEILTTYPNSLEIVREWFLTKMIESLKTDNVSNEFKEQMRAMGVPDETLITIIDHNPRTLFDLFDANKLYIEIVLSGKEDEDDVTMEFTYRFPLRDMFPDDIVWYRDRKEAEKQAIEEAFSILEQQLTS
jgi:hypothetical protein